MKAITIASVNAALVFGAAVIVSTPAVAGTTVPGPMLGAGAPALAVIAGGYWLIRRFRRG